ncbi:5'/3'-nucleotidase SurE [Mesorhizobium australicum]|uniref:5'-nucleotidase SurE n=1 Tax=Mesorhizobium australicum TaxID=536018 RepID=A0A1X7PEB7_9HYPH|nr:5'/3'-nucleotidase SurE [Mesorhizobium australicum]SMH48975.1 5'-nucleotidase /3'-nucleotidase /exopolyphosphatase [Mesorhizobium australicum]
MRILLTNDDGIHAEGLMVLERIARQLSDDVWVVAPENDQSGFAHSLSLSEPLRVRKVADKHYALRGTPTDCVIMGVRNLMPEPPDLVLSGVNSGSNIADDVTYSGTVAGAMEGTLIGIRSIALSQSYQFHDDGRIVPWGTAESLAPDLLHKLIAADLPKGVFLNVNFPNCEAEEVEGVEVTSQGKYVHGLWVDERQDGRGLPYYWLRFGKQMNNPVKGTDIHALDARKISVTPMKLDLTAHETRDALAAVLG